jgi:Holliday junction DNA helicase RuvB
MLAEAGNLVKQEDYINKLGYSERTDAVIEPKLSLQWFLKMDELSKPALEHVLLHGPPGLGKTTLAHVIAKELGTNLQVTSGPALSKGTDLVAALTRLQPGDVLFIDEIHRLPATVEEFIYPAMEDFKIDITLDGGLHARTVEIRCAPFTLIGATTRAGLLTAPMRSRFGIVHHLRFYSPADLRTILARSAALLGVRVDSSDALATIADRSRGTPRIANRLLRRVRDYAQVRADGVISRDTVDAALALEGVDHRGLDDLDRAYLSILGRVYGGGPAGLDTLAATMNEDAGTLEDVVEPYLLQLELLARTRKGRMLTAEGARMVGVEPPALNGTDGLF